MKPRCGVGRTDRPHLLLFTSPHHDPFAPPHPLTLNFPGNDLLQRVAYVLSRIVPGLFNEPTNI